MAKRTDDGFRELDFTGYKPAGKNYQPPADLDDMGEVIELGLAAIRENRGRIAKFEDSEMGLERFYQKGLDYFEKINQLNSEKTSEQRLIIPDFEGFCLHVGITRQTLATYDSRGGLWSDMIGLFKNLITAARKQLCTSYKVPPIWEIFNLVNNSVGYQNTNQITITADESRQRQQDFLMETKLSEAGLVWDKKRGEYLPVTGGDGTDA